MRTLYFIGNMPFWDLAYDCNAHHLSHASLPSPSAFWSKLCSMIERNLTQTTWCFWCFSWCFLVGKAWLKFMFLCGSNMFSDRGPFGAFCLLVAFLSNGHQRRKSFMEKWSTYTWPAAKKTTLSKKGTGDHHLMVENGQQKMHDTSNKSQKNVVSYSQ